MRIKYLAGLFACTLFSSSAFAEGHLQITLMPSDSSHPTKVTLTLMNDGDALLSFDKYSTPLALLEGTSTSFDQFTVTDVDSPTHNKVSYMGMVAHPLSLQMSRFITLAPGKALVAEYDLWPNYLMMPGKTYAVTFNMTIGYGPRDQQGNAIANTLHIPSMQEVKSNEINITVPDTYTDRLKTSMSTKTESSMVKSMDASHQSILSDAISHAYNYAVNTYGNYRHGLPPDGTPNGKSIDSPAYAYWFGSYNSGDDADKLITGTLSAIASRLYQGPYGTALHKISFIEGCPDGTDSNTAAIAQTGSVVTNGTYEIRICDKFWSLPSKPTKGTVEATQAFVMVHEISHFADLPTEDILGWTHGTTDWQFYSYIRSAAHQLVSVDRHKAAMNASNFEYFIEDMQEYF